MSDWYERDLRAWLTHRDEMARRATAAGRVVARVEARTLERPVGRISRTRVALMATAVAAVLLAGIGLPHVLLTSHPRDAATAAAPGGNVPDRRPPSGVALVWVPDPADPTGRIIALDHTGRPMGWLPVQGPLGEGSIEQSGDGQRLVLTDYDHAALMEVTAQGQRISLPPTSQRTGPSTFQTWNLFFSDDNHSLCLEPGPQGTPRPLVIIDAAGHVVHTIPEAPVGNPSYLSWHVMTCSVRNDLAVLVGRPDPQPVPEPTATPLPATAGGFGVVSGSSGHIRSVVVPAGADHYVVRVVRLSTGAELARRAYGPSKPEPIDASEDGSLVLERDSAPNTYAVRNIATGALVTTLDADVRGLLGNHLAIEQGPFAAPAAGSSQVVPVPRLVVDLTTGRTVWSKTLPEPSIGTVSYVGDSVVLAVERHGGTGDVCTAWDSVEIADLLSGTIHDARLDTCPTG